MESKQIAGTIASKMYYLVLEELEKAEADRIRKAGERATHRPNTTPVADEPGTVRSGPTPRSHYNFVHTDPRAIWATVTAPQTTAASAPPKNELGQIFDLLRKKVNDQVKDPTWRVLALNAISRLEAALK